MSVTPATRRQIGDHFGQAEFSLNVANNFACLVGTPAGAAVQVALAEVMRARVRSGLEISQEHAPKTEPEVKSVPERLPLTRKERISLRHLDYL